MKAEAAGLIQAVFDTLLRKLIQDRAYLVQRLDPLVDLCNVFPGDLKADSSGRLALILQLQQFLDFPESEPGQADGAGVPK